MPPTRLAIIRALRDSRRDAFAHAAAGARESAASPWNRRPAPTPGQAEAGNYTKGRVHWQGFNLAIEHDVHGERRGVGPDGKPWSSALRACYGEFSGTRGADGDPVDVFLGPFPENTTVWVVNQRNADGSHDEHKVLAGFVDASHAMQAYRTSYAPGWSNFDPNPVPLSLAQLRKWLAEGDMSKPLTPDLVPAESDTMSTQAPELTRVFWDSAAEPRSGLSLADVLYMIRRADGDAGLVMDPATMDDWREGAVVLLDSADDATRAIFDGMVIQAGRLQPQMTALQRIMASAAQGIEPVAFQISEPLRRFGGLHVAVLFELSDGQTVTFWFHNPDSSPTRISPVDDLVSWKVMLNKKDVTIAVAPEKGQDLNVREVGRRLMRLAAKNSEAFARTNARRAETMQIIADLKAGVAERQATLEGLMTDIEAAKVAKAQRNAAAADTRPAWKREGFDPTTAEGYAIVLAAGDAALDYHQDTLDVLFSGRYMVIRDKLRDLGWVGQGGRPMTKDGVTLEVDFLQPFPGRNVLGQTFRFAGNTVVDDLSLTREDLAVKINDMLAATVAQQQAAQMAAAEAAQAAAAQAAEAAAQAAQAAAAEAFARLKALGWVDSRYPDVLLLAVPGVGALGTMVTPDGTRNFYARIANGALVANLGDDTIGTAALGDSGAAAADAVNAAVLAYANEARARNGLEPLGDVAPSEPTAVEPAPPAAEPASAEPGTVPADVLAMPEGNYVQWEDKLTTIVEFRRGVTRSDAQAMVEAGAFPVQQQWGKGAKAIDAYEVIWGDPPASAAEERAAAIARVDAAYSFGMASDDFKALVANSIDADDYSAFKSAVTIDKAVADEGGAIAWNVQADTMMDACAKVEDPKGAALDDAPASVLLGDIIGIITFKGAVVGRATIGSGDGKAMLYVGADGGTRPKRIGSDYGFYFDEEPEEQQAMVAALFAPLKASQPAPEPGMTAEVIAGDMGAPGGFALIRGAERKEFRSDEAESLVDNARENAVATGRDVLAVLAAMAQADGWWDREPAPPAVAEPPPEPAEVTTLRQVLAGDFDRLPLGELLDKIEGAIKALDGAGLLVGDVDTLAGQAVERWAELTQAGVPA